MVFRSTALSLALGTSIIALSAYAAEKPIVAAPITDIRLSSGGLAEIRRQAEVTDNSTVTLTVPLSQIDDILKSLTIKDPKGNGGSVSLAGKMPLAEVFRDLPFSESALSSQPRLIGALQGAAVTVSGGGINGSGRITGVEPYTFQNDKGERSTRYRVTLFGDGKLLSFDLDKVDIGFDDPKLQAKLEKALESVQASKTGDARDITIDVKGSGSRSIAIDYVVPAPVWKATYRLTLLKDGDKADIQGWAIIENTSSDDWENVRLSLSSGSPVTLHQRLHEAYFARRPEVPIYSPNGIVPLTDKGGGISAARKQLGQEVNRAMPSETAGMVRGRMVAQPAPLASEAVASSDFRTGWSATLAIEDGSERVPTEQALPEPDESDISTLFTLPTPVTLSRGQSLTLPFLNATMSATRVSVFQPQLGITHPVAAVMVKNDGGSSLPPGILTLTEDGLGYAGDAQLAGLPAGETRMIMFATDRKVQVTSDISANQRIEKIIYDNGALKADVTYRQTTTYRIKGAQDGDRTIVIEHPRRSGFTYGGDQIDGETPTAIRMKVKVPKGKSAETKLVEQRTAETRYSVTDLEENGTHIAALSLQAVSDPELTAKIKDAAKSLEKVNEAAQALSASDNEAQRISNDQSRIRENLKAVPAASDLAKTYLATMAAQEKRLNEIAATRAKGEEALKVARAEFVKKLKAF